LIALSELMGSGVVDSSDVSGSVSSPSPASPDFKPTSPRTRPFVMSPISPGYLASKQPDAVPFVMSPISTAQGPSRRISPFILSPVSPVQGPSNEQGSAGAEDKPLDPRLAGRFVLPWTFIARSIYASPERESAPDPNLSKDPDLIDISSSPSPLRKKSRME
jgi:hypothetical protein